VRSIFELVLRAGCLALIAPLLPGIVNRTKAWFAGRQGPPVLQLYYDLARLWSKGTVLSTTVSPWHMAGPAVAWVAIMAAGALLPMGNFVSSASFRGDAFLFIYLLAAARFCMSCAALDTGSAFEGMGAAREVSFSVLAEAATMTALLALALKSGSVALDAMLKVSAGSGTLLLGAGLFIVLLSENSRVPFDDPNTHLELTMVHEAMVLDHSGPGLAAILHGAAVKLLVFSVLLVQVVLPMARMRWWLAAVALAGGLMGTAIGVGLVESLLARFAFKRLPLLLTTAFVLCLFGLLAAWKGPAS
jgi:formate hydrogenlyase subunit 4